MNDFSSTGIETAVASILKGVVSATVYNNRPKAAVSAEDFVVVKLAGSTEDMAAYGDGVLEVALFARDVQNLKNGIKLDRMYQKMIAAMPAATGRYLLETTPNILADVPDDYGFHARIITFKFTIKVQ